jgi:hypothetical protein
MTPNPSMHRAGCLLIANVMLQGALYVLLTPRFHNTRAMRLANVISSL